MIDPECVTPARWVIHRTVGPTGATGSLRRRFARVSSFPVFTRPELILRGHTWRSIAAAVDAGALLRPRAGAYLPAGTPDEVVRAVRIGGRLTCLSLLQQLGIFVHSNDRLHVQVAANASRLRAPDNARRRLRSRSERNAVLHWTGHRTGDKSDSCATLIDALAHSVRCQQPRNAIATLDSALNGGHIGTAELDAVFTLLPARFRALRPLVDGRAMSGTETLVRLIARALGCRVELQVHFAGVGFVDLLIDGWLVIECDSRAYHGDWASHAKDRKRDAALAALGHPTLRVAAATALWEPESVAAAIRGLRAARAALAERRA